MTPSDQLSQYTTLLRIRHKARRRDALVSGGIFLVSAWVTIALGLLSELQGREIYLITGLVSIFGLSFVMTWVRLEIIKNALEFADYLQREAPGSS